MNPLPLRMAMLGMVEGNGHPYSWSAIINGAYDRERMADCGFPVIAQYLAAQPPAALGIPGANVTHIWCEDAQRAKHVSATCFIDVVAANPQDVIGEVDAVIISTDFGDEHLDRARPFIDAGLPVFIDKPLTTEPEHLRQFIRWRHEGKRFLSTSAMRYAHELIDLRKRLVEVGEVRLITSTTPKSWERYGIHALEAVYGMAPAGGWISAANSGDELRNIVHLKHANGLNAVIVAIDDLYGCFGVVNAYGTEGHVDVHFTDTFSAFKAQLVAFVDYVRSGIEPFDFAQTAEQMKIIIAGSRSRREGGRTVMLSEI